MKKFPLVFLFLTFLVPGISFSENQKILTLQDCIAIALQGNLDMGIALEDQKSAVNKYKIAQAEKMPEVFAVARTQIADNKGTNYDDDVITLSNNKDYSMGIFAGLSANYHLVSPQYSSRIEIARRLVDSTRQNEIQKRGEVILNIKKCYYEYLSAVQQSEIRKKMLENSKKRKDLTAMLVRSGEKPLLDLSMFEVNHAQIELDYKRADSYRIAALDDLLSAMGVYNYSRDSINLKDIDKLPELAFSEEKMIELASSYSPALKQAKIQNDISRLNIDLAKSQDDLAVELGVSAGKILPKIYKFNKEKTSDGTMNYERNYDRKNWNTFVSFTLSATLPLYTGGAASASVSNAVVDYVKSGYSGVKLLNETNKSIRVAYQTMLEMKSQIEISRLNIRNAQTNLKLSQMSYESGSGSQTLVQNAEYSLLQAEFAMVNARYSYMKNLASLSYIIGLDEEDLCLK